ncbi:MAG: MFS transporter [Liquorilactobacillus ghanensis]|uniref:MFS transporter n=1 Tax=Liquorilactobacillus ghanensis TaxID=399370 RepID=UPI0039E9C0AA
MDNKISSITNKKMPLKAKIGFGAYQVSMITDLMNTGWQMYYLTTFIGMTILNVTLLTTISKIIGAVLTPIYGYISDHLYQTKFGKRFGRRKSVMLIGIPLKIIFFILMWIPGMPLWIYYVLFLVPTLLTPMLSTVQLTFLSEMTENSQERAQLAGSNQIGGAVAGVFFAVFTTFLFKALGQNTARTFVIAALIYDVIAFICLVIFYRSVYERPIDESTILKEKTEKPSIGKDLVSIFWDFLSAMRLKSFVLYLGMYVCEQMFRSLRGTINTYFIIFVLLLSPATVTTSTGIGFVFGLMFLSFYIWYTAKTNGPKSYRLGAYSSIVVFAIVFILAIIRPPHLAMWFTVMIIAMNFGITGVVNSTQFIFTFIPDVDEMVTAKRREGQYAGVQSTLDTIFTALETIIIGAILTATGFVEKSSSQNPETVKWLLILYTCVPIVLCIFGIIISHFFKLTVQNHKILMTEVERLRAGGSMKDVTPEARQVVEELTGFKYEDCWGNNNMVDIANRKGKDK